MIFISEVFEQKCVHEWKASGLWDGKTPEGKQTGGIVYACTKCKEKVMSKEEAAAKGGTIDESTDVFGRPASK
ncbi:MAG: hypothetical protein NT141_04575 [candidate division WWE3 bacterium]|nr:hypothetical protein [candidate division WWE3 bacterium]